MRNKNIQKIIHFAVFGLFLALFCPTISADSIERQAVVPVDSIAIAVTDTLNPPQKNDLTPSDDTPKQTLEKRKKVYRFDLSDDIFPSSWRKVKRAVEEAEKQKVDIILMRLNTYGGEVKTADSIRTKLLKAKPTTIVLIDNNAASAGALISLACDSIYMVEGAQIGAATVVNGEGKQMPDKYQSYMRATMRSTAEKQGRDPKIAEAMVDHRIAIKGVIDSTKTLTFTSQEAVNQGFSEGIYNSIEDLLQDIAPNADIITFRPQLLDGILGFLMHPMVSGILMLVMFMGIYSEIQTPGVGFPILAAIIAAGLYFAPNYLEGLAQNWEILLFIVGIGLLAIEIFVIPGFGLAGLSGLLCIIIGLTLSLVHNDLFDFSFTSPDEITMKLLQVVLSIGGAIILAIVFGGRLLKSEAFSRLILQDTQNSDEGYTIKDNAYDDLLGKEGVVISDLNIAGRIEISDEIYEAISTGGFIEKGAKVLVKEHRGNYLVVKELNELEVL